MAQDESKIRSRKAIPYLMQRSGHERVNALNKKAIFTRSNLVRRLEDGQIMNVSKNPPIKKKLTLVSVESTSDVE